MRSKKVSKFYLFTFESSNFEQVILILMDVGSSPSDGVSMVKSYCKFLNACQAFGVKVSVCAQTKKKISKSNAHNFV